MRVFLIIVGVLVLLTVLLCISHVVVSVRYWDGKFDWSVRYLGIKLLPRKKSDKPPKPKKEKKKKKQDEEAPAEKRREFLMDKLWNLMQSIAGKADLAGSALFALPGPLGLLPGFAFLALHAFLDTSHNIKYLAAPGSYKNTGAA